MKYMVNRRNAVRLTTAAGVSAIFAGAGTAAQAATPNAKRNSLDLALDTFFGGHQSLQPAHSGALRLLPSRKQNIGPPMSILTQF